MSFSLYSTIPNSKFSYPPLAKDAMTKMERSNPGTNSTINIKNWSVVIILW